MLFCMRTTLLLEDGLYRDVKSFAAREGRTVTSLVEEALREYLRRAVAAAAAPTYRVVPLPEDGGTLPGVDLTDSAALLDLLEQP